MVLLEFFFFKQKTAYEVRISGWSSDVCSSDLVPSFSRIIFAPMLRIAAAVASTSSPSSSPVIRLVPIASAPSIRARWLVDLSPGTAKLPVKGPPAAIGKERKRVEQGKRVSVRVELGGRSIIKKKNQAKSRR